MTMTENAHELEKVRSKEIITIAVDKSRPKSDDDKQVTMTELLAAYALYKTTLDTGVLTQSQTMNLLYKVQDKSMVLASEQMKKMLPEMEKAAKEQQAAGTLSLVGTILGIAGFILMFVCPPAGIALMAASGACLIAAGGLDIAAGAQLKKVADQKGDAIKDQAVSGQVSTAVQGLSTQLNNTINSTTSLEQAINAILDSYGKANKSAGPQQHYTKAG